MRLIASGASRGRESAAWQAPDHLRRSRGREL